jgi:HTH-type transcriptional regulator / antitoxin HigA
MEMVDGMEAKRLYRFEPNYAVAPGATLRDTMDSLEMSQRELADRTGLTVQTLNRILKGVQPISYETANRLELVTGVPARMWNSLEAQYRDQLTKLAERQRLETELAWLQLIPTQELIQRGDLQPQSDTVLLLRETLAFFGVSSVEAWHKVWDRPAVAARRSSCFETRLGHAATWIRLGERKALQTQCGTYDQSRFKQAIEEIRRLTPKDPAVFEPAMKKLCAEAGVAVALVPEMKKVPWNGATEWLSPSKAMILLNLRGKGEDKFWFSFFHEAGHVLHDSRKELLINDGTDADPREERANRYAAEVLVPSQWDAIITAASSPAEIRRIAQSLGVSAGIVAGRYQYLTKRWSFFKPLIRTLKWANKA